MFQYVSAASLHGCVNACSHACMHAIERACVRVRAQAGLEQAETLGRALRAVVSDGDGDGADVLHLHS
eukprot:2491387-Pleurochrysis_carterae.AAC.1